MTGKPGSAPRVAALVGPYLVGKTTLLESMLVAAGAITRKGSVRENSTVGDASAEARSRQMSVEVNVASAQYLGDAWTFIDCPGSIEIVHETHNALMVADVAIVVCEPTVERALTVAPILKFLDDYNIPHFIFVNRIDTEAPRIRDVLGALQSVSERALVLRQVPIRGDNDVVTGYVDLVSERAYQYKPGQPSDLIPIPTTVKDREQEARAGLLEALADFDDSLLEQLLQDTVPSKEDIYKHLTKNMRADRIVPVFLGSAERDNGSRRLLKALRHEVPEPSETAARRGIPSQGETLAQVFKTLNVPHVGKLSLVRVWRGSLADGASVNGTRVGGMFRLLGLQQTKVAKAEAGEVVAFGRTEGIGVGDTLTPSGTTPAGLAPWPQRPPSLFALSIAAEKRNDEVKLSAALHRLVEEDPSLSYEMNPDTGELLLWGQGEIHLQIAADKLRLRYNMPVTVKRPQVPYKETIRKSVSQHGRHKRQTGGHGQFGDVHIDIKPRPRGAGFMFEDKIVGGAVPRNFIPGVEEGVIDYLKRGPLGFPVVDVGVALTDGSYHAVDSSEMAFKTAARIAMSEGMPKCDPVLLEPIFQVKISGPTEFTSKVQRLLSQRRGHILGFDAKPGWRGWDEVAGTLPQSEMHDLIIELRSLTLGVGTFEWKFDHLAELTGRLAEKVVETRQGAPAAVHA